VAQLEVLVRQERARIVHLVFLGIGLLLIYWAMPAVFAKSTVQGVLYIVQTVLNIAGVVLLFTPPASAWYKVLREARR
jgi:NADH:ubiquinone oxidoreductase subunit 6 (subunit J)